MGVLLFFFDRPVVVHPFEKRTDLTNRLTQSTCKTAPQLLSGRCQQVFDLTLDFRREHVTRGPSHYLASTSSCTYLPESPHQRTCVCIRIS